MLDEKNQSAVKEILSSMEKEVELLLFTKDKCKFCPIEKELLAQISEIGKVKVSEFSLDSNEAKKYGVEIAPTVVFKDKPNMRISGIPSGHEFRPFLDTLIMVSNGKTELSNELKAELKKIDKSVEIKVFVTPTCPYCTKMVFAAHQFAMENANIQSTMVEATEFPELSQKNSVMSVPKTVLNDTTSFEGAVPEHIFIKKILELL
ncbi:MAG: glutaredoxin [Candidatus Altiarchaeota archaeon]|nr:glutaredoxin [Candidatus Altiarchaeota archaeon]